MRTVSAAALGFVLAITSASGRDAAAASDEAALRAKVMRFIGEHERGAGVSTQDKPDISIEFADLNDDGTPEALVIIKGALWCGARGCSSFVLDLSGPEARSIGDFIAVEMKPLPSKTGQWRDIALNGRPVSFRDGAYRTR